MRWLAAPRHRLLAWHDPDYPALLRRIASPPLMLFVAGDATLPWHPSVAIVGSRAPSAGGADNAFAFARAFAASGLAALGSAQAQAQALRDEAIQRARQAADDKAKAAAALAQEEQQRKAQELAARARELEALALQQRAADESAPETVRG